MKALILAGGYAKRLWPLTENMPKSLLIIHGRPMINYIMDQIDEIEDIEEIIVSTNHRFASVFRNWMKDATKLYKKPIKLIIEPTMNEHDKFGAIGGINFVIESENINSDLLIVGGDNLTNLDLRKFVSFNKQHPVVALYRQRDIEVVKRCNTVSINDDNWLITSFKEKNPDPKTNLMAICCYHYPANVLNMFKEYLASGANPDAPGFFVQWLHKKMPTFGYVFDGYWFDIGSFDVYEDVQTFMENQNN